MRGGPSWPVESVRVAETASTNDDVRALAVAGAPEGTVVRADVQRAGRGRAGRSWASPPGGLWVSILLRPGAPPSRWGLLPLLAGTGVAAALRARGVDPRLKWPNDVLVGERKIAGILVEARPPDFAVLGVGVNADVDPGTLPAEAAAGATSLAALGRGGDVEGLARDLLRAVEARYRTFEEGNVAAVLAEYRAASATLGRRVATAEGVEGLAVDVLEDGRLLVETEGGPRLVAAGDVSAVRVRGP